MTAFFYKHENDLLNHFISSLDYKIVSRHDNECNATSMLVTPWRMFERNPKSLSERQYRLAIVNSLLI